MLIMTSKNCHSGFEPDTVGIKISVYPSRQPKIWSFSGIYTISTVNRVQQKSASTEDWTRGGTILGGMGGGPGHIFSQPLVNHQLKDSQ